MSKEVSSMLVYLVDDDEINNFISRKVISMFGAKVEIVEFLDPNEALEQLEEVNEQKTRLPDFIFLDINMPQMSGWNFLEKFKEFAQFNIRLTKIIMLSSSVFEEDISRAKKYDCVVQYLSKPLSIDSLEQLTFFR